MPKKEVACKVCGCSEERACRPFGCSWVTRRPPVCSACVQFFMNVRDRDKLVAALAVFGLDVLPAELEDLGVLEEA